jgi:hypothetical protein
MRKPFLEFFKIVHVIRRQKANLDRVIYAGQFFIQLKAVHLAHFDVQKHHVVHASLEACKRIGRIAFLASTSKPAISKPFRITCITSSSSSSIIKMLAKGTADLNFASGS